MTQYKIDLLKFEDLKDKIEIPKFQRGLVWSQNKKKEFIKTLKNGLPIGILLLAPNKENNNFLIIDGLQRFSTMKAYNRNPSDFLEKDEISDSDVIDIIVSSNSARKTYDEYNSNAQELNRNIIREEIIDGFKLVSKFELFDVSDTIAENICKKIAFFSIEDHKGVQRKVHKLLENFLKTAAINDIEIPVIIYNGAFEKLTDIFQKLNQEGVKLTKYDVFAATWMNHTVTIKNDTDFIDLIIKKYNNAQTDSGLEITDFDADEMRETGILSVYEYAFAVGKELMKECKLLFKKNDEKKVDGIGFLILAELLGLTYQNMGLLAEKIDEYNKVDYKQLKDGIIDAGKTVEVALKQYITAPTKNNHSLACHSELQIASFIITVFNLKYSVTKENGLIKNNGKKPELKCLKQYLYKHYLYDILREYWSGAGDTKLEDIVNDPFSNRYLKDVGKDAFEQAIINWLDESIQKKKQENVSSQNKLFWNYFLVASKVDITKGKYDIEHCVPQKILKKFYISKGIEVPISSACNLCYIDMADNRCKGEKTYYQKQAEYSDVFLLDEKALDKLLYPSRMELQFVESVDTLTEDHYMNFLKERKNTITKRMMDILF